MKQSRLITAKELKALAASIKELASTLEEQGSQCLQCSAIKVDRWVDGYGVNNLEFSVKLSVFGEIDLGDKNEI